MRTLPHDYWRRISPVLACHSGQCLGGVATYLMRTTPLPHDYWRRSDRCQWSGPLITGKQMNERRVHTDRSAISVGTLSRTHASGWIVCVSNLLTGACSKDYTEDEQQRQMAPLGYY